MGEQNYRSGGVGVQKVTGNFGKEVQDCRRRLHEIYGEREKNGEYV